MADTPAYDLIVVHAFDGYQKGDRISDPDEVAKVLAGENAHYVHKVVKFAKAA